MSIIVSTRALGKRKPLLADFSIDPPTGSGGGDEFLLRDLIESVVRQEVSDMHARRQARRFDRVIAAHDMEAGAIRGKIDPAGKKIAQPVDADAAVSTALSAFEDGMYLVIVDEIERRNLDEPVRLREDSRITFLRLTFLAGA